MADSISKEKTRNIFSDVDLTKLPEALQKKLNLEKISRLLKEPKALSFLVAGRTGAGKSTFINGLLGMRLGDDKFAPESRIIAGPCTSELKPYTRMDGPIHVTVWDTCGLLDGSEEKIKIKNMKEMVDKCSNVDLKLICIDMSQKRFVKGKDNADVLMMIEITEAFKVNFWRNAIIVLTFANDVESRIPKNKTKREKADEFSTILQQWKTLLHERLKKDVKIPASIVQFIRAVPAGSYEEWQLLLIETTGCQVSGSSVWMLCQLQRLKVLSCIQILKGSGMLLKSTLVTYISPLNSSQLFSNLKRHRECLTRLPRC